MIEMSLENINGIEVIHSAPAGQRQQRYLSTTDEK